MKPRLYKIHSLDGKEERVEKYINLNYIVSIQKNINYYYGEITLVDGSTVAVRSNLYEAIKKELLEEKDDE